MTAAWATLVAEGEEASKTGSVGPGLTAFVVVLLLVVATVFLMRSMLKHVGRVPETFDAAPAAPDAPDVSPEPAGSADGQPEAR